MPRGGLWLVPVDLRERSVIEVIDTSSSTSFGIVAGALWRGELRGDGLKGGCLRAMVGVGRLVGVERLGWVFVGSGGLCEG